MPEQDKQLTADEDIEHWQHLLVEHKRYLRIVEKQLAGHGKLGAPPELLRKEEIVRDEINDVTQRIRRRIKHMNDDGLLYSDEEVDNVVEHLFQIHAIELQLDSLIATREEYKRLVKASKKNKSRYASNAIAGLLFIVVSLAILLIFIFIPIVTGVGVNIYLMEIRTMLTPLAFILSFAVVFIGTIIFFVRNIVYAKQESESLKQNSLILDDVIHHVARCYEKESEMKADLARIYKGIIPE